MFINEYLSLAGNLIGGFIMDMNAWVHHEFLFVVPVLLLVGVVLKHQVEELHNGLIPTVMFVFAFFLCSIWGYQISNFEIGGGRIFDALIRSGLSQGFIVSAIAAKIYDAVHGANKARADHKMKVSEGKNGK